MNRHASLVLASAVALSVPAAAFAVPLQVAHQGELSDVDGPITDSLSMTFRLFDTESGGNEVWSEVRTVDIVQGHYVVLLGGAAQSNPIEDVLFQEPALFLEITVESDDPLLPRQPVASAPYAIVAGTAENLSGGTVDASSIAVNGLPVVNGTGQWVGPAGSVDWSAIAGAPADADTLGGLSCADGSVAKYVSSSGLWACGSDLVLTSEQVLGMVDGATVDLGAGSSMATVGLATLDHLDWALLGGIPAGFADGIDDDTDTVLTETQVLDFVDGAAVNLGAGSQMDGADLVTTGDLPGLSQAQVYLVRGTSLTACTPQPSAAFCNDADDVVLSGWCGTHHLNSNQYGYTGGSQGPLDASSPACPVAGDLTGVTALGSGPQGWGCLSSATMGPAFVLCLSVD